MTLYVSVDTLEIITIDGATVRWYCTVYPTLLVHRNISWWWNTKKLLNLFIEYLIFILRIQNRLDYLHISALRWATICSPLSAVHEWSVAICHLSLSRGWWGLFSLPLLYAIYAFSIPSYPALLLIYWRWHQPKLNIHRCGGIKGFSQLRFWIHSIASHFNINFIENISVKLRRKKLQGRVVLHCSCFFSDFDLLRFFSFTTNELYSAFHPQPNPTHLWTDNIFIREAC